MKNILFYFAVYRIYIILIIIFIVMIAKNKKRKLAIRLLIATILITIIAYINTFIMIMEATIVN